jgi:acetolactate synthase-1/2/3 large subunit
MIQGGHFVAKALKAEGVSHLFTLCGGHIQAIYDGCITEGIRVVDVRHEQSAGHAADGWARATGQVGVCAVTAGPGVTDVVTAAANALRAGVPMVIIGGAGPTVFRHMGSLQDMDHIELMKPVTKWSATVTETRRLAEYITIAFRKATTGVPGPVFLEMPLDVLMEYVEESEHDIPVRSRTAAKGAPDPEFLAQAAELLKKAERPMAIIGSQIRWSSEPMRQTREFLEKMGIPTFVNGMARGLVDPKSEHFFNRSRKGALAKTDCMIICGTPFDFRLSYGVEKPLNPGSQSGNVGGLLLSTTTPGINPEAKIIQVDIDPAEVGRNRGVDVGIVSDTGLFLEAITAAVGTPPAAWAEWKAKCRVSEQRKQDEMKPEMEADSNPPNPLRVCAEVNKFLRPGDIVIGDGGDFVATAAYVLRVDGVGTWMDPGPLGTLGVGPGYAMAAQLAHPDKRVVLMLGDGSFGLNGFEFEAMARQGIPVVGIVGNDACWSQIWRGQVEMYGPERCVATTLDYTRYDIIAQGMGCHGEWVERIEDLGPALERAFACGKPAVVNVKIARSDFRQGSISV